MADHRFRDLPTIFPTIGPVTRLVLFADFNPDESHPSAAQWEAEYQSLIGQGLAGLTTRVVRERGLSVPDPVLQELQQAQFRDMSLTTTVVKASEAGLDALSSAGIPFVVSKGPGIAMLGASMVDRPFIDIDVIVRPSRFTEARNVLASVGYAEDDRSVQAWDSFNRLCREAINLRAASGGSIDLHHRVAPWFWSTGLTFDVLDTSASPSEVFGVRLPLLSPEYNLLVSALHVVSDKSRPGQTYRVWRDLLVLARSSDPEAVVAAAEQTGLSGWLAWILRCLPDDVQPKELCHRLDSRAEAVRGRFRLRMLLPPRFGSQHVLGQVFRLPLPHALLFFLGMLVPSRRFLRSQSPDGSARYLTWWRSSFRNLSRHSTS